MGSGANRSSPVAPAQTDNLLGLSVWRVQNNAVRGALDVPLPTPTALATPEAVRDLSPPRAGVSENEAAVALAGDVRVHGSTMAPELAAQRVICSYPWPQGCDYWIAVAFCESSLNPLVIGHGGGFVGLYQIWLGHGYGYDWLLDPANSALAAWELSDGGTNTAPWPICRWQ